MLVDEIAQRVNITPLNFNSNTLQITLIDNNAEKAYDIVKELAEFFIEFDRIKKGESINNTIDFLNSQMENFGSQYDESQDSMKKFRLESGFTDPTSQINARLAQIQEFEKAKLQTDLNLNSLNWLVNYLNSGNDLSNLSAVILSDQSSGVQLGIQRIIQLQTERNLKLLNVTPDHPNILLINAEIISLKSNLLSQIRLALEKQQIEEANLDQKIRENYDELFGLPDLESAYEEIKKDNDLKKQFYLSLVEQKNLYLISKAGIVSDYIVLEPPKLAKKPIAPNIMMVRIIGVVVGLLLGLFLILARYLLHSKVSSLQEVQGSCNANILGIIPSHKNVMDRSAVVAVENPKSSISESFRAIRANLEFLDAKKGSKIITTTSTIPGEGKTFIGINLAAIFSLLDKKVIILDFDLRKPRLAKIFDLDSQKGVSTILIGRSTIEECIFSTGINNLDFMPS